MIARCFSVALLRDEVGGQGLQVHTVNTQTHTVDWLEHVRWEKGVRRLGGIVTKSSRSDACAK